MMAVTMIVLVEAEEVVVVMGGRRQDAMR